MIHCELIAQSTTVSLAHSITFTGIYTLKADPETGGQTKAEVSKIQENRGSKQAILEDKHEV